MSESLDQLDKIVEGTSAPDEPHAEVQARSATVQGEPRRRKAAVRKSKASAKKRPETEQTSASPGLPVVVGAPQEATSAVEGATAHDARPSPEETAAARFCAPASKLVLISSRSAPPRQKRARFEDIWFKAAAIVVALGIGWLGGANTFDQTAQVRRLAVQLRRLDIKLAGMEGLTVGAPASNLGGINAKTAALQRRVSSLDKDLAGQRVGLAATRGELEATRSGLESVNMSLEAAKSDIAKLDQLRGQIGGLEREVSSLLPTASISATPKAESAALAEARRPSIVNDNVLHALPMYVRRSIAEQRRIPPNGYVLRGVRDGVAIVETRTGLRSVVPGVVLAGAGRVESIARRGRRWVVLTSQGLIDSDPY